MISETKEEMISNSGFHEVNHEEIQIRLYKPPASAPTRNRHDRHYCRPWRKYQRSVCFQFL